MPTTKTFQKVQSDLPVRAEIINEIINLIIVLDLHELNGWEDIEFSQIDHLRDNSTISMEELFVLRELLDNKYEEMLYQMYLEEYYLQ